MALVFSESVILWADLLTDLTGAGTNDGITTDAIAWAEDQNNWYYCTAVTASTSSWTALPTGGVTDLDGAVDAQSGPVTQTDRDIDWRITDTYSLTFGDSGGAGLLDVSPTGSGNAVTVGGTVSGDTVLVQGPTTGTGFLTVTHAGADTVPLMTWTTSGSGGDSIQVFTGSSSPNGRVTGAIGSLFLDGTNGNAWVNTDGSTTWADLTSTGGATAAGIEGALYGNLQLYVDAGDRNSYDGTMGAVSGGTVTDLSGGTTTTTTVFDFTDSHFNFDASTSHIDFGTLATDQVDLFATGGSVAAWVRAESDGEGNFGSIFRTSNSGNTIGWYLAVEDESAGVVKVTFALNRATTDTLYKTARNIPLNEWLHIVLTYDGSDPATKFPILYINGELYAWDSTQAGSGSIQSDSGQHASIGARWLSGTTFDREWDGDIDVFQLWDRVLSAVEARQLYRVTGEDRFRPSLLGDDAATSTEDAPDVEIKAGEGGSTSGAGGDVNIEAGGVTSGTGGSVNITAADGTSGAGSVILNSGTTSSSGDGGLVSLRPGSGAGTSHGYVDIDPDWTGDADPLLQFTVTGTNVTNSTQFYTGNRDPDTLVTGAAGSLYLRAAGINSKLYVNRSAGTSGTTWEQVGGAALATQAGLEGIVYTNNQLYFDAGDRNSYSGTGSSVSDMTGSRLGTMTNVTATDGHFVFNGTTSNISFTSDSNIEDLFDGGGTIIAWVRADAFGGSSQGRIASTANTGTTYGWFLGLGDSAGGAPNQTYKPRFYRDFTTADGAWRTTSTVSVGQWVMLAVTYDSSSDTNEPTLYINGVVETTDEVTAPSGTRRSDSGNPLIVGDRTDSDLTWEGAIDIVMLFDSELSENSIRQIYNVSGGNRASGLTAPLPAGTNLDGQDVVLLASDGGTVGGTGGNISVIAGSASQGNGGVVNITSGTTTDFLNDAGNINIVGGESQNYSSRGGDIYITGGEKSTAHSGDGGDLFITGGSKTTGDTSGLVGAVTIKTGTATGTAASGADLTLEVASFSTGNFMGHLILQGGSNTSTGSGDTSGEVRILGGDSAGQNSVCGPILITGGEGTSFGGRGGAITLTSGSSTQFHTGAITLQVPAPTSSSRATGNITLSIGDTDANFSSNPAGDISLSGGDHTGSTGSAHASSINISAGASASSDASSHGGDVLLQAGDQSGSGSTRPGTVSLVAGDKTGGNGAGGTAELLAGIGNGSGSGGEVAITAGAGGATGTGGVVDIDSGAGGSTSGAGGAITINTGGATSGSGGSLSLTTANGGAAGAGGNINFTMGGGGATGTGGDFNVDAGNGGTTSGAGGDILMDAGNATDGGGGVVTIATGDGGGANDGGTFTVTTGDAGSSGSGGDFTIATGDGATAGEGGDISFTLGAGGATGTGGDFGVTAGAGGSTSGAGGDISFDCGGATSGNGGSITGAAGDGGTNGDGGSVTLTAGAGAGTGGDGNVSAFAEDDGSFQHRTQSTGFTGTQVDHKTYAIQQAVAGGTNEVVVVLGTLDTDGNNMKFTVHATGVDNADDSNVVSYYGVATVYRDGGTIAAMTHTTDQQIVGTTAWQGDITVSLNLDTGNDEVEIQVSNDESSPTYTINWTVQWTRQEGGFSS